MLATSIERKSRHSYLHHGVVEVEGKIADSTLLNIGRVPLFKLVLVADVPQDGLRLPQSEAFIVLGNEIVSIAYYCAPTQDHYMPTESRSQYHCEDARRQLAT